MLCAISRRVAAARRATDVQLLEDAEQLIATWPGLTNADTVLADDRRRNCSALLVSVGMLPSVPDHQRDRFANARPAPRRGGN